MTPSRLSAAGFTLTELLVTLAILGILVSMAVPSFKSLAQGQRVQSASFDLYAALVLARSEAIKRNGNVTVSAANVNGWEIKDAGNAKLQDQSELANIDLTPVPNVTYTRTGRLVPGAAPVFTIDAASETTVHRRCVKVELSGMPRIYKPSGGNC